MQIIQRITIVITFLIFSTGISQNYLFFRYSNFYNTANPLERQAIIQYDQENNSIIYVELKNTTKFKNNLTIGNEGSNNFLVDIDKNDSFLSNKQGTILFNSIYGLNTTVNVSDSVKFDWELVNEKKEINGYQCYKAISNFRGRKWEAWYSPEIAINYGPWKFWGLPGLIFEVSDVDKTYNFFLSKIESKLDNTIEYPLQYRTLSLKEFIVNESNRGVINNLDRNVEVKVNFVRKTPELIYEWEENK